MAPTKASTKASNSAGRVIAGTARGRLLASPGEGTRPIGDRVKETLFAILEPVIRDRSFLDLFAGSGAAGIEALSR
ncbi:MAG: RsmD family RNA methyltransferase, partial [Candidatus Limnocylindrales bacterium]